MNFDEIINSIIKPFVVEQPYEVPGEFYMSNSSNTNQRIMSEYETSRYLVEKRRRKEMEEYRDDVVICDRCIYHKDGVCKFHGSVHPDDYCSYAVAKE